MTFLAAKDSSSRGNLRRSGDAVFGNDLPEVKTESGRGPSGEVGIVHLTSVVSCQCVSKRAIFSAVDLSDVGGFINGWRRSTDTETQIDGRFSMIETDGALEVDGCDDGIEVLGGDGCKLLGALYLPLVKGRVRVESTAVLTSIFAPVNGNTLGI